MTKHKPGDLVRVVRHETTFRQGGRGYTLRRPTISAARVVRREGDDHLVVVCLPGSRVTGYRVVPVEHVRGRREIDPKGRDEFVARIGKVTLGTEVTS